MYKMLMSSKSHPQIENSDEDFCNKGLADVNLKLHICYAILYILQYYKSACGLG